MAVVAKTVKKTLTEKTEPPPPGASKRPMLCWRQACSPPSVSPCLCVSWPRLPAPPSGRPAGRGDAQALGSQHLPGDPEGVLGFDPQQAFLAFREEPEDESSFSVFLPLK